jgi:hypothetical protein
MQAVEIGSRWNRLATVLRVVAVTPLHTTCVNERTGRTVVLRAGELQYKFLEIR